MLLSLKVSPFPDTVLASGNVFQLLATEAMQNVQHCFVYRTLTVPAIVIVTHSNEVQPKQFDILSN